MSNFITITDDATNAILKTMQCWPEYQSLQASAGQTIHQGRYPKAEHTYDGAAFTQVSNEQKETPEQKIIQLDRALKTAGLHTELAVKSMSTKQQCKDLIDLAADKAKLRYVSKGILTPEEYTRVEKQSREYLADTSQTIPPMVQTVCDVYNLTGPLAAQFIVDTADAWDNVIYDTYDLRLKGKKAVDDATTATFKTVAQNYIDQLNAL